MYFLFFIIKPFLYKHSHTCTHTSWVQPLGNICCQPVVHKSLETFGNNRGQSHKTEVIHSPVFSWAGMTYKSSMTGEQHADSSPIRKAEQI